MILGNGTYKVGGSDVAKIYLGETEVYSPGQPWTLVVVPDLQEIASHDTDSYAETIQYILNQQEARNIQMVMFVGDNVDDGASSSQWTVANNALALLEGEIPFSIGIGNHDYDDDTGVSKAATSFNSAFPLSMYQNYSWFIDDEYPTGETTNHAVKLTIGQYTYLFINIEYQPRTAAITWAQGIVDNNTDADYIIVNNHYFLGDDSGGEATRWTDTSVTDLWDDFISQNNKIRLVVCGHVAGTATDPAVSRRVDGSVNQHLFNAQTLTGDNYNATAYLRFYEIDQSDHSVSVTTYNPIIDTALTDSDNQFSFNL